MSNDEHIWFDDHAAAYALGGLSTDERERIEVHAAACPACAAKLAAISETDRNMNNLFASVRPGSGFEQAIIDRLDRPMRLAAKVRSVGAARWVGANPLVRRAAVAAAAAIVLGGFGYVASEKTDTGQFPTFAFDYNRVGVVPNLTQMGQGVLRYANDNSGADRAVQQAPGPITTDSPADIARRLDNQSQATSSGSIDYRFLVPSSNPQKWDYGGGTNTAQNWCNWNGGAMTNKSYSYEDPDRQREKGTNAVFADGHVEFDQNPFVGVQRDNIQGRQQNDVAAKAALSNGPGDGNDSILLPNSGGDPTSEKPSVAGGVLRSDQHSITVQSTATAASQILPPAGKESYGGTLNKAGTGALALSGVNDYTGGTTINAGTLQADDVNGRTRQLGTERSPTLNYYQPDSSAAIATPQQFGNTDRNSTRGEMAVAGGSSFQSANGEVSRERSAEAEPQLQPIKAEQDGGREAAPGTAGGKVLAGDVSGDGIADVGIASRSPAVADDFDTLRKLQQGQTAKQIADASPVNSPVTASTPAAPAPAAPPSPTIAPAPPAAPPPSSPHPAQLKVIRNGTMDFVVDSFDSALLQVTAIVAEEGGYVGTTNSQKLPNGKVEGTIIIRVAPENLDVLVLKLRALGELKDQKITSEDVTQQYTDLSSELRAARAMEDRLLDLIKDGKGAIKDLLAAEKELGEWREKIEKITGQMNYYDNLVAMSTLQITLTEKDIKTPALASQSETVDMGVEAEDVEKARTDAIAAIDEVKGRIVESELKQFDAGQMAGKIVADIAPDKAGPVIDHLKQLGTVSRLEVQRAEVTTDGHGNAVNADTLPPGLRLEQKDTRLTLSLYNLANVAPRQTVNVDLACDDVDGSYHAILDRVAKAGGRVISSNLSRPTPDQVTGSMSFEVKSADADGVLLDVKSAGDVMVANVTENPDTNNVTGSKRGFSVQLRSMASVNPKQTVNVELACDDVDASYHAILDQVAKAGGRVIASNLSRPTPDQVTGTLAFEVKSTQADGVLMDVKSAGDVMQSSTAENQDVNNVTPTKRGFMVQLRQLASVNPREVRTIGIATADVTAAYGKLLATVQNLKARIIVSKLDNEQDASGNQQNETAGWLDFEVKRGDIDAVEKALADAGDSVQRQVLRSNDDQNTLDTKVQFKVGLHNATLLPPREQWTLAVESGDVDGAQADVLATMGTAGGRVVDSTLSKEANGKTTAHLVIDVPLDQSAVVVDRVKQEGDVRVVQSTKNPQAPEGKLAKARLDITIGSPEAIVSGDRGLWSTVRAGLTTSVTVLLWSLQLIVTGVCLIAPFAAVIWGVSRVAKRKKATP